MSQLPEPPSEPQQAISTPENQSVSVNVSLLVAICAAGLLLCFFLPWIDFLGAKASGLDIAKNKGESQVVWLVPLFSLLTIIAGLTKKGARSVAQLTGALPYFLLIYGIYKLGTDFVQILGIGGYLSLFLGLVLFIIGRRVK